MEKTITLGTQLSIADIVSIADGATVVLPPTAVTRMEAGVTTLQSIPTTQVIYGINTGFGPMAYSYISEKDRSQLQYNLIRSHACGTGRLLEERNVRAIMAVRAQTLSLGYSAAYPAVVTQLVSFLNAGIHPTIPEHGSVGASGDLVQLAHIAYCLIGEGTVQYQGKHVPTPEALIAAGLQPLVLQGRDGLALINGTAAMTGIAALNVADADVLLRRTLLSSATLLELFAAHNDIVHDLPHQVRPHNGQQRVTTELQQLLIHSSHLRDTQTRRDIQAETQTATPIDLPQELYSLRCIPQILGPIVDTLANTASVVTTELNAVTDNPLLGEDGHIVHNGNFHGDYIALAMDTLRIATTKLSMLLERQLNFVSNDRLNKVLPPYANVGTLGLTLAFQATQFVATSTTSHNQTLATPIYTHSIPTNNDNQDVVSLGTDSALLTATVIHNTFTVLSILTLQVTQAVEIKGMNTTLAPTLQTYYQALRDIVPPLIDDRSLTDDIETCVTWLRSCKRLDIAPLRTSHII